jgi:hypothetical protein
VPEAPLNQQIIEEGFDRTDLREIRFDCTTSWVYPEGGQSPGWYGLHREAWLSQDSFLSAHLAPARLVYQQTWYYDEPPFALFQWNGAQASSPFWTGTRITIVSPDESPSRAQAAPTRTAPLRFDGPLTFLGYQLSSASTRQVELETAWKTEAVPTRPLAITAQLVGTDGSPIANSEGLGVPVDQWQAGDILTQRHRFEIPAGARGGTYWLQVSAHWLDSGERWQVQDTRGDRLILTSVEVR